ncbi:MAG: calcium/sodium antiporter [archaeon]
MVMVYILLVLGIALLIKSADWIVDSSSSIAKKLGVSSLVIGLTIVAFGTSLPELVVNLFAAFKGSSEVVFGNIIGSNIANILLVLGVVAIVGNVKIKSSTIWKEIPFALLAAFMLFALTGKTFFGGGDLFSWDDGLVLLALFAMFLYYIFQMALKDKKNIGLVEKVDESNSRIALRLIAGLVGIYFAGGWVVDGAVSIAELFGLSEFLISATIVAIGTSLPELVVSVMAVLKKNVDLAVGNIVGSNIFNVLWVLGIVPFVMPLKIPKFIGFDIGIMFLATLLLFIFMFTGKKHGLNRKEGIMFVLFYILYIAYIIIRG